MTVDDWPLPPISPEDLPLIRELLTDEEYAELLRRMVQVFPGDAEPSISLGRRAQRRRRLFDFPPWHIPAALVQGQADDFPCFVAIERDLCVHHPVIELRF